ncbi:hypothetical protein CU669_06000 [Paramagnetospirillum kuznetsovii]|uniref:Flagellin N-terminal domain-containing protein n=1 Tax=Paramagnetospirillum kuznetsovii TaxID=2053833 RepID=A0A364P0R6_9PROT|nr:hypothetical protein [Paramagnetospirillum kuznetsovii]RAU22932.1 hypothetical protein CU669_06000 [Paramagnetospirillum kuznetsovii]
MALSPISSATGALSSIQQNQDLLDTNLRRLSTGRSVNSASDNSQAFVLASGLLERAGTLTEVGTSIGQGIGALQAAGNGLDAITKVVGQLKSLAKQAEASSDPTEQANLQSQYNTLRGQIDGIASDSSYNGVNLIAANPGSLTVPGASAQSTTSIGGKASDANSLGITAASGWAGNTANIQSDIANLDAATSSVRARAQEIGANVTSLQTQASFYQNQAAIATQGANGLTASDPNEAAANAASADTYRQLGLAALRNAGQGQEAVLALFSRQ